MTKNQKQMTEYLEIFGSTAAAKVRRQRRYAQARVRIATRKAWWQ